MKTIKELIKLRPEDSRYWPQPIPIAELIEWFETCEALWVHNGDPKAPHAELTSGKCSNGFIDCLKVLSYPNLSEILAIQLAKKIREIIGQKQVDWVIASPMAGITFGHDAARALGAKRSFFTEKDPTRPGKMLWNRLHISEKEVVLQIEELITTAQTLNAVKEAVDKGNPTPVTWLPIIGALVHRPEHLPTHYDGRQVVSLIEKEIWAVDKKDCPLCAAGSRRYRPKKDKNWGILTGKII